MLQTKISVDMKTKWFSLLKVKVDMIRLKDCKVSILYCILKIMIFNQSNENSTSLLTYV